MHVSEVLRFVDDTPKDSAGMPAAPIDVIDVRVEDWPARDEHADSAEETDAPMHAPRESALQDSVPQAGALPESEPQGRGNEAICPGVASLPAPDGEEPRRRRCTSTESVEAGAGSEGRPASACDPVAVQGEAEVSLQDMSEARREGLRPASAADFGGGGKVEEAGGVPAAVGGGSVTGTQPCAPVSVSSAATRCATAEGAARGAADDDDVEKAAVADVVVEVEGNGVAVEGGAAAKPAGGRKKRNKKKK